MATVEEVNRRKATIVAITKQQGQCSVADIAHRFAITPETVRRDLKSLESQGLLRRVHGGAVAASPSHHPELLAVDDEDNLPVHQLQRRKQAIAHAAVPLIPSPESSIFIDAGSTTEAFAHVLAKNFVGQHWRVVTNSPNVARTLSTAGLTGVSMLGGIVKGRTQAVVGQQALACLEQLRADVSFMGTNGLSLVKGLSTSDPREAAIKRAMIERSKVSVVLCDSAKLDREAGLSFAELHDVDVVVTDRNAPGDLDSKLLPYDIKVVIP